MKIKLILINTVKFLEDLGLFNNFATKTVKHE